MCKGVEGQGSQRWTGGRSGWFQVGWEESSANVKKKRELSDPEVRWCYQGSRNHELPARLAYGMLYCCSRIV